MLILYILILFVSVCGISFHKDGIRTDYVDKSSCNSIKGIFILVVFIRHAYQYISESGYVLSSFLDRAGHQVDSQIGQLLVAMFLFYSGYGVMESIRTKGCSYVRNMPRKRILGTLMNFDVAVLVFLMVNILLGIHKPALTTLLAFTGWTSIGNSNWYIFGILLCYCLTYLSFVFHKNDGNYWKPCIVLSIFCLVGVAVLSIVKETWWYNTLLCYPLGVIYSLNKSKINDFVSNNYLLTLIVMSLLLMGMYVILSSQRGVEYNCLALVFALFVVLITMKFKIGNPILLWLGNNLFPLYIYQRLGMIVLSHIAGGLLVREHVAVFLSASFVMMLLFAYLYNLLNRCWNIDVFRNR